MADGNGKKTVIMMSPDGKESWDIPEDQVQNALKLGAKMGPTPPPPVPTPTKGVPELVGKAAEKGSSAIGGVAGMAKVAGGAGADFISGIGASLTGIPGQLMRLGGGDPSKVVLAEPGTLLGGKRGVTLESIGKPPEGFFGKAGEAVGEIGQLATAGGAIKGAAKVGAKALAKAPQVSGAVSSLAAKAQPILSAGEKALRAVPPSFASKAKEASKIASNVAKDTATSSTMEYSKTGNADEAIASASMGSAVANTLAAAGKLVPGYAKWLAQKSLKVISDDPNYHRELADRLIATKSVFSEAGAKEIEKRFGAVVGAMKDASRKADYWLNRVNSLINQGKATDPSGIIPATTANAAGNLPPVRLVPFPQILESSLQKYMKKATGANLKDKLLGIVNDIKKDLPMDEAGNLAKLTFKEAEDFKASIQANLSEFYNSIPGGLDEKTQQQVRKIVADAMRQGQRVGFDILKSAAQKVKIPSDANIKHIKPWQLKVPGVATPVDYKQAGKIAQKDSDLSTLGKLYNIMQLPQEKSGTGESLMNSISASQLAHGSILTPSQVASIGRAFTPGLKSQAVKIAGQAKEAAEKYINRSQASQAFARLLGSRTAQPPPTAPPPFETNVLPESRGGEFDAPLSK